MNVENGVEQPCFQHMGSAQWLLCFCVSHCDLNECLLVYRIIDFIEVSIASAFNEHRFVLLVEVCRISMLLNNICIYVVRCTFQSRSHVEYRGFQRE